MRLLHRRPNLTLFDPMCRYSLDKTPTETARTSLEQELHTTGDLGAHVRLTRVVDVPRGPLIETGKLRRQVCIHPPFYHQKEGAFGLGNLVRCGIVEEHCLELRIVRERDVAPLAIFHDHHAADSGHGGIYAAKQVESRVVVVVSVYVGSLVQTVTFRVMPRAHGAHILAWLKKKSGRLAVQ